MQLKKESGYLPFYFSDARDLVPTGRSNKAGEVEMVCIGHSVPKNSGYQCDDTPERNQVIMVPKNLLEDNA